MRFLLPLLFVWMIRETWYVYRCTTTGEVRRYTKMLSAGTDCDLNGTWIYLRTETVDREA